MFCWPTVIQSAFCKIQTWEQLVDTCSQHVYFFLTRVQIQRTIIVKSRYASVCCPSSSSAMPSHPHPRSHEKIAHLSLGRKKIRRECWILHAKHPEFHEVSINHFFPRWSCIDHIMIINLLSSKMRWCFTDVTKCHIAWVRQEWGNMICWLGQTIFWKRSTHLQYQCQETCNFGRRNHSWCPSLTSIL